MTKNCTCQNVKPLEIYDIIHLGYDGATDTYHQGYYAICPVCKKKWRWEEEYRNIGEVPNSFEEWDELE